MVCTAFINYRIYSRLRDMVASDQFQRV